MLFFYMILGGTYKSPVTGLPTPIELGGFMLEAHSDRPVPIIGVTIDEDGKVVPVSKKLLLFIQFIFSLITLR